MMKALGIILLFAMLALGCTSSSKVEDQANRVVVSLEETEAR